MKNLFKSFKYVFFISLLFSIFSITSTVFASPTVSVSADPTSVYSGSISVISWDSADTNSCTLSGGGITGSGTSNTGVPTNSVTSDTTYTVSCVKDAIPEKCFATNWGYSEMYQDNKFPGNTMYLGLGNDVCNGYTSSGQSSCLAVQASRFGTKPVKKICSWYSGASQETTSDSVTVTVEPPVSVSVTANPTAISCSGNSTINWNSPYADSCDSGGHGTNPNGSFPVSPTTTTNYPVTCTKNAQTVPAYCSGTYIINQSYCGVTGTSVSGSYCGNNNPPGVYENSLCSSFTTSYSCSNPSDPWCTHPCSWFPDSSPQEFSCSGLPQTDCGNGDYSNCTWHPQTTTPAQSDSDSATVTVSACSESVDIYDPNAPSPGNGPYYQHTQGAPNGTDVKNLKVKGTNIDGKQCELFKDGVSFVENGFTNPWFYNNVKSFYTNAETILFSPVYKVICDSGQAQDRETVNIIDPDLITSEIVFYPDNNPVVGSSISMYAQVTNQGNYSTENSFSNFNV